MALDFSFLVRNDSIFNILLPFVLIFTIIFAVLQATKILGGKKNIDAIIGIVFGLLLIRTTIVVETINRFLPNVSLAIIVVLMILLLLGVFLGEEYEWASSAKFISVVLSIIVVLWIFSSSYWKRFGIPDIFSNLSSETKGVIVFIILLIIVITFVTREKGGDKFSDRLNKIGDAIFKNK